MSRFTFALFPEQASTVAAGVDHVFYFLLGISAFFTLLIAGLIAVFMVRFRRRSADGVGIPVRPSLALEAAWTGIPLGIVMIIFFWGASIFATMQHPPADAVPINVVGKQWMWKLQHMEGQREINELHIPLGRAVRLKMTSEDVIHSFYVPAFRVKHVLLHAERRHIKDVIHSFYVPAFRVKQDVLPGRYTQMWFHPTKPGKYHLFCAEYCGTKHSQMIGHVFVMEPLDYQKWLAGVSASESPRDAGEKLFASLRCDTCHNTTSTARGPWLGGLGGSDVPLLGGGKVKFDADYVRESILAPNAKTVAGFQPLMPTYAGQVSEEQILALIAYIETLPAPGGPKEAK